MTTKEITDLIIQTYLKRIDELSPGVARHFLYRASQIASSPKLEKLLEKAKQFTANEKIKIETYINDPASIEAERNNRLLNYEVKKVNDAKKLEQWKKHLTLYAYHSIIWCLFYLKIFNLSYPKLWESKIKQKSTEIIDLLLNSSDFIKFSTVSAINIIFLSKNCELTNKDKEFVQIFKKLFANQKEIKTDPVIFTNYIYGLTHIIIGTSNFYQKKVNGYNWILKEFQKYENRIFEELTLDINTEVALCYKLCNLENENYINKVEKRLMKNFNPKEGYIVRESDSSFRFAEHTNAITLLLFNFDKLNLKK